MSDPVLNCQTDLHNRPADKPLTVGDTFLLSCDGEMPAALTPNARLVWAEEASTYSLHILKVNESTTQHVEFLVTSYKPAQYSDMKLKISDGLTTVETSPIQFTVNSVLSPTEKPEPVPSKGPFFISYPLWLWITLASIVFAIGAIVFFIVHRKRRRQKMLADLDKHMTMLPPFNQLSKDLRVFVRDLGNAKAPAQFGELADQLDRHFRLFLIRQLRVPALEMSNRAILGEIKKQHRSLYEELSGEMFKALSELSKAKKDLASIRQKDCEDLLHITRNLSEKIYTHQRNKKGRSAGGVA